MMNYLIRLSKGLAANASLFIIDIAVVTFFVPDLFVWVRGTTQTVILGIIMLTMGLTLTTDDFRILARRPLDILIGACAQFFIMPCVAYLLVHVFRLEPALALGILLVGCCPGGVSSCTPILALQPVTLHSQSEKGVPLFWKSLETNGKRECSATVKLVYSMIFPAISYSKVKTC